MYNLYFCDFLTLNYLKILVYYSFRSKLFSDFKQSIMWWETKVMYADSCPETIEEWNAAAKKRNCVKLMYIKTARLQKTSHLYIIVLKTDINLNFWKKFGYPKAWFEVNIFTLECNFINKKDDLILYSLHLINKYSIVNRSYTV